jgi:hypothetical protein
METRMISAGELNKIQNETIVKYINRFAPYMISAATNCKNELTLGHCNNSDYNEDADVWTVGPSSDIWRKIKEYMEALDYKVNYDSFNYRTTISWYPTERLFHDIP